jgi:hypothetical protein
MAKCLLKDMENFMSALFGSNLTNNAQWDTISMANEGNKIIYFWELELSFQQYVYYSIYNISHVMINHTFLMCSVDGPKHSNLLNPHHQH